MITIKDASVNFNSPSAAQKVVAHTATAAVPLKTPAKVMRRNTATALLRASYAESWPKAKQGDSKRPKWRQALEDSRQLNAMEALSRLLRFQESLESSSGRGRQLRDFARDNAGTRAAKDALTLAGGQTGPIKSPRDA